MVWAGFLLLIDGITGVQWFHPGDFSYSTAMAYHGQLIPVWMLLLLAFSDGIQDSYPQQKTVMAGVLLSSVLTGTAALFIHQKGISFPVVVLVMGLVTAEVTALFILYITLRFYLISSRKETINRTSWLAVFIALAGMSLATPAGHLSGALQDMGNLFPHWISRFQTDDLTDAHSHQMLASLLAVAFALPFLKKSPEKRKGMLLLQNAGLILIIGATITQVVIYQTSAWAGWEPPILFSHQPNGIPLDDAVLSVLGLGMLMLLPALWMKVKRAYLPDKNRLVVNRMLAVILAAYLLTVVVLGIYIEFHERFFGQATGQAPGVQNDLAFIRSHILFGFMMIPIISGVLLHAHRFYIPNKILFVVSGLLVTFSGAAGVFLWTWDLNSVLMRVAVYLTIVFLWVSACLFWLGETRFKQPELK